MFQIIIAGGRDFNDYPLLERTVDQFLADVHDEITIFCGTARGADSLGERYAKKRGYAVRNFPPDWRGRGDMIRSASRRGLRLLVTRY